jgi:PTH1 family peptidyl-tRNA hydrolase
MNLSGDAVKCLVAKPERSVERLLVISDDLALPLGTIRIRRGGSHGGQNGLRSIIRSLGTENFSRLRIGIKPEHPISDASRFVLDTFSRAEESELGSILSRAAEAVETIIRQGIDEAMARFNQTPPNRANGDELG